MSFNFSDFKKGVGVTGLLFGRGAAEKNLKKYVGKTGKRDDALKFSDSYTIKHPEALLNCEAESSDGYARTTLGDVLEDREISIEKNLFGQKFLLADGQKVGRFLKPGKDRYKVAPLPDAGDACKEAVKTINDEAKKSGIKGAPKVSMTTKHTTVPDDNIVAYLDEKRERIDKIKGAILEHLPGYTLKKSILGRDKIVPFDVNYDKTLGSIVDDYDKHDVYDASKELVEDAKSGELKGYDPLSLKAAEKLVAKKEGIHKKRNIAIGAIGTGILLTALAGGAYAMSQKRPNEGGTVIPDDDFDDDGMIDSFEHAVGMPADVHNGRYAIVLKEIENQTTGTNLAKSLVEEQHFEPQNVIKLLEENATKAKLLEAVSNIASKANENDTVVISFSVDSSDTGIGLKDRFMSYAELDKIIDNIHPGKMLITISGCGREAPIEPLSLGHTNRIVSNLPQEWLYAFSKNYLNTDHFPSAEEFDKDNNNFISFAEILNTAIKYQTGTPVVSMSDKSGIATKTYLGGFSVNDKDAR